MRRSTALSFKNKYFLIIKKIKGRFFNYKKDPNQSTATKTSGFKSHRANSPNAAEKS